MVLKPFFFALTSSWTMLSFFKPKVDKNIVLQTSTFIPERLGRRYFLVMDRLEFFSRLVSSRFSSLCVPSTVPSLVSSKFSSLSLSLFHQLFRIPFPTLFLSSYVSHSIVLHAHPTTWCQVPKSSDQYRWLISSLEVLLHSFLQEPAHGDKTLYLCKFRLISFLRVLDLTFFFHQHLINHFH